MKEYFITKNFNVNATDIIGTIKLDDKIINEILKSKCPFKISYAITEEKGKREISIFSLLMDMDLDILRKSEKEKLI